MIIIINNGNNIYYYIASKFMQGIENFYPTPHAKKFLESTDSYCSSQQMLCTVKSVLVLKKYR